MCPAQRLKKMIDLFSVKLNGEYDEIGATPTIENGLFLCDTTSEEYTRGYSYEITEGEAKRVDTVQDYKIEKSVIPTILSVCKWLNNDFFVYSLNGHCCGMPLPETKVETGDLVCVLSKNLYFLSEQLFIGYATVKDGKIIVDNPEFNPETEYTYWKIHLPPDVEQAISQMVYFDVYTRGTVDGLKSESIGSYSYTKNDVAVGSLAYPSELVGALELNYRKVRLVQ